MAARKKKTKRKPAARKPVSATNKKKPVKSKGGRPRYEPTPEQRALVEACIGYGLTYKEIATLVVNPGTKKGISTRTLQDKFVDELDSGASKVKAKVIASLVKKACSDNHPGAVTAAIWITKARFGWKGDHVVHEVEGAQGVLVAPAGMTPEQWIARANENNKGKKPPADD